MDCTFCLECVKACPQDNIGILPVAPGRELVRDPVRSSLGKFSRRPDIAALALVLAFSAFASAAAMVAPVAAWRDRLAERLSLGSALPATSLFFLVALVLAPALMVGLAVAAGRLLGPVVTPARELFCRLSLALVPLGLAMWGAHVLVHLLTGWNTPWPVLQRATTELGIGWLGQPHWTMSSLPLASETLVATQLLLLDAGLLLSLYIGWRVANAFAPRVWASVRLLTPWAAVAAGLYASGIWILLQPMQMRGMVQ
jgi:hypothetical protein